MSDLHYARAVAEAAGHWVDRTAALLTEKIEYVRPLKDQGMSLGQIAVKTGIPKALVRCYVDDAATIESTER